MTLHVVSLPHTEVKREYSSCAYTQKVRNFMRMFPDAILYSPGDTDLEGINHVQIGEPYQHKGHYTTAPFDPKLRHWQRFNRRTIVEIDDRYNPGDFVCVIGGTAHEEIGKAFTPTVEFGVGYAGTFSQYRVFESYAWMHMIYAQHRSAYEVDGGWYDTVIPGYLDINEFPYQAEPEDYYLYVGRVIDRKGWQIAADVCKHLSKRLIIAGPAADGMPAGGSYEYVGAVGPDERNKLMSGAIALFAPSHYIEPFGNVAIEAMACGTPVISSDWGAFPETNVHGFRCRTFAQFVDAAVRAPDLHRFSQRAHVKLHYDLPVIQKRYADYFDSLRVSARDWYGVR